HPVRRDQPREVLRGTRLRGAAHPRAGPRAFGGEPVQGGLRKGGGWGGIGDGWGMGTTRGHPLHLVPGTSFTPDTKLAGTKEVVPRPWRQTDPVLERTRFVLEQERSGLSISELCRRYGISRPTGYQWIRRYRS